MSERHSIFILFIGLMLCISLWRISLQDLHTEYTSFDTMEPFTSNDTRINNVTASSVSHTSMAPLELPSKNDANVLIDLNKFDYLINQAACDDPISNNIEPPIVIILIHSAARNWHKRNVIRETWGEKDPRARIYFLLGAVKSSLVQKRLELENKTFEDIIQGNFIDAYRNMTYKHTMALKWFVYNCPKVKYLLKADDDVFVNTPAVYDLLEAGFNNAQNLIFCYRIEEARVKRTYRSKWRVSTKEFRGWYYPPYCPGFTIIYSSDVVSRLYQAAQKNAYLWIDDVYITGVIAQLVNINITPFSKYYMNDHVLNDLIDGKRKLTDIEPIFLFTEPNLHEKQIRDLWKIIKNSNR